MSGFFESELLKEDSIGQSVGIIGVTKGDSRSLDYSSYGLAKPHSLVPLQFFGVA